MKTAIIMYALIAGIVFVIVMAALVATVGAVEVITMEYPEDAGCGFITVILLFFISGAVALFWPIALIGLAIEAIIEKRGGKR